MCVGGPVLKQLYRYFGFPLSDRAVKATNSSGGGGERCTGLLSVLLVHFLTYSPIAAINAVATSCEKYFGDGVGFFFF